MGRKTQRAVTRIKHEEDFYSFIQKSDFSFSEVQGDESLWGLFLPGGDLRDFEGKANVIQARGWVLFQMLKILLCPPPTPTPHQKKQWA